MYSITTAIRKIAKLKKRIRAVQGGTSAAKTVGILAVLVDLSQRDAAPTLTSIVSESFPHLKRGVIRDFLLLMDAQGTSTTSDGTRLITYTPLRPAPR